MDERIDLQTFCRQVRERSRENRSALALLQTEELYGNVVATLRQELDSMVRVIFLLSVSDSARRNSLIDDAVNGRIWRNATKGRITDHEMIALAHKLHGWSRSIYRFGCAFIHLSSLHDYRERDPMNRLSQEERTDLLQHLRYYHGGPASDAASFRDIVRYLPAVFEKVARNLECYLNQLERGEQLESHEFREHNT